ncbi:hypothetical protein FK535_11870 [Mycolicibacterium sp. 018/SC-01/001]|uniref:hypothetical protein n=1 Tax=Mycolicibacterium sp. 018/SC-01/001 TaxID=2592069 RepID=UPI00117DB1D3|nr:hypothetical protein [Mycolicibacterium sp. 018/SC-01/001]TRW83399.1 hypothetical protein FK535_11870 [Mycolicibacterium sp. 018/SC-01/001]
MDLDVTAYSVRVSAEAGQSVGVRHPRRAVIDAAWRAIGPGVECLSGDDGAPLTRTVKRIIDPLVLRLRVNTRYSAPVVTAEVAAEMHRAILEQAATLQNTAAWFDVLKRERRRLRITQGNAQELYFPVCYELAVTSGVADAAEAERVLRDVHADRDRTAIDLLNAHVADAAVVAELDGQLDRAWRDVRPGPEPGEPFFAGLGTVLADGAGHTAGATRARLWSALVDDMTPYNLGAAARLDGSALPWSLPDLGLSSTQPQQRPVVTRPTRVEGERPLDRSVVDRVRATLRRGMDRDELPDIALLCAEEVDRCAAPWGLLGEDKQATLLAGIEVATDLAPLDPAARPRYGLSARIQVRLRKEAYVLHARRYLADGAAVHPRQQQVIDELASFRRPYLNRLWARLHGRDVWQEPCSDADDVRALLDGVARSVSLDHRQRIKAMLGAEGAA